MTRRKNPDGSLSKPGRKMQPENSYSKKVGKQICDLVIDGKGLRQIERMEGMPDRRRILKWVLEFPEFAKIYAIARELSAERMDEEIMECATNCDKSNFQAMRVKIEAYRWRAERLNPKQYSLTSKVEHKGQVVFTRDPEDDKMV